VYLKLREHPLVPPADGHQVQLMMYIFPVGGKTKRFDFLSLALS
jgi:hypothetical protein